MTEPEQAPEQVIEANLNFYFALESLDVELMEDVWSDGRECLLHPSRRRAPFGLGDHPCHMGAHFQEHDLYARRHHRCRGRGSWQCRVGHMPGKYRDFRRRPDASRPSLRDEYLSRLRKTPAGCSLLHHASLINE